MVRSVFLFCSLSGLQVPMPLLVGVFVGCNNNRREPGQFQSSTIPSKSSAISYTHGKGMVFVELCCGRDSCLRQACMEVGVSYIGCHDCMIVFRKRQFRERSLNLSLLFVDLSLASAEPRFTFTFLYHVLEAVQF